MLSFNLAYDEENRKTPNATNAHEITAVTHALTIV